MSDHDTPGPPDDHAAGHGDTAGQGDTAGRGDALAHGEAVAGDGGAPARVRPWWRRRRPVAGVAGAVALVVAAGVVAVVRVSGGPAALPAPRTLPRDPVPAGPLVTVAPANCGITATTLHDLVPRTEIDGLGDGGCSWATRATDAHGARGLTVNLIVVRAGDPGVSGRSSIGAAILRYRQAAPGDQPVAGLGSAAVYGDEVPGMGGARQVVLRAGNLVATVRYSVAERTGDARRDRTWKPGAARDGVLRAAADVAASVGAPAHPRTTVAPAGPGPATFPAHMCSVVPKALRDRLVGDDAETDPNDEDDDDDTSDPLGLSDTIAGGQARTCSWSSDARRLTATITTSTADGPGVALRDVTTEYLRRHYEARDEQPISAHDTRYFHALAGLGDQGFCAYLEESSYPGVQSDSPARCVVRVGVSLVSITYGSVGSADKDENTEPLTRREAVAGAYAALTPVVAFLRN